MNQTLNAPNLTIFFQLTFRIIHFNYYLFCLKRRRSGYLSTLLKKHIVYKQGQVKGRIDRLVMTSLPW